MPGDARAARATVCAVHIAVVVSPGGFTVDYLFRRDRVVLVARTATRRWSRIRTPSELRG